MQSTLLARKLQKLIRVRSRIKLGMLLQDDETLEESLLCLLIRVSQENLSDEARQEIQKDYEKLGISSLFSRTHPEYHEKLSHA